MEFIKDSFPPAFLSSNQKHYSVIDNILTNYHFRNFALTMRGMRIGIDVRLPYYQMGGISQYALHLLPALAKIDTENEYVIYQSRKDERTHAPDAPNFRMRKLWTPCHHKLERSALSVELVPDRLDVLHSPDFIPPRRGAKRHVITVHDLNFLYYPQYLTQESLRYYNGQIEWAVQKADVISADSHHTRNDLIEKLNVPPEKIHTIHLATNPVYSKTYSDAEIDATLEKYNLPRDFILFVGTIEPRKNLPKLLQAYRALINTYKMDTPLVIVGRKGWKWRDTFQTLDVLRLRDRVHHLEDVFDESLAHLYHAAGVLVMPSHYEGFGLPPLEAMQCGCPTIVSDRGSLPEIVGDAGVVLDADNVADWLTAMYDVLYDSELRQTLIAAGHKQAAKFNWENTARQTLGLYELVMQGK